MTWPRVFALPDGRVAVAISLASDRRWLLVDSAGRMAVAEGQLSAESLELRPWPGVPRWVVRINATGEVPGSFDAPEPAHEVAERLNAAGTGVTVVAEGESRHA